MREDSTVRQSTDKSTWEVFNRIYPHWRRLIFTQTWISLLFSTPSSYLRPLQMDISTVTAHSRLTLSVPGSPLWSPRRRSSPRKGRRSRRRCWWDPSRASAPLRSERDKLPRRGCCPDTGSHGLCEHLAESSFPFAFRPFVVALPQGAQKHERTALEAF